MNRLYKFHSYIRKMGNLNGIFAVDDRGEKCLRALIASEREVHFGEVLGKHSDINISLLAEEVTHVEATPEEIATILRIFGAHYNTVENPMIAVIQGLCPLTHNNEYEADPDLLLKWCQGLDPEEGEE